ncbi:U3 snoRNP-associated protein Esf2 [Drechmeria coniospora]|uniref:18S rRNA factor 2 n=1 Tax=Drechmeria coniospora TaxID=98403 RepID=A0A151GQF1_DRECN|nr:U3 snoRNP-associated protein Esf2 [Drechmeria coniospora]KYK59326.1 U3 snoRNP-associated protein Esf2 [Drechmeria coniospora]ODA77703.1 hypothetical protein RJ55_06305 [Drechmeria coniospora]
MAPPKRNEFLDASDSEDDQADGYNSDNEIAKGGRTAKRRRVDSDQDEDDAASDAGRDATDSDGEVGGADGSQDGGSEETKVDAAASKADKSKTKPPKLEAELPSMNKPAGKKNLVATDKAIKKSGVVFLSRVPPFMKPNKVRSLLQPYGTINRIFLAPQDPTAHARRVRAGGNKKKLYTEGWVEFVRKKDAKAVCELLNARVIGGKKGSYYHDDLWNLLYLKGFKWHHLTDQIASENAERTSRMRAEISKATRENKDFVRNVERAKMLDGMQAKSKKRKAADGEEKPNEERPRTFQQVPQVQKASGLEDQSDRVTRALSKIF